MRTSSRLHAAPARLFGAALPLALSLAGGAAAQHPDLPPGVVRCATPARDARQLPDAPGDCSNGFTNPLPAYAPSFVYRIPVVFHVIERTSGTGHLTLAQIQSQIDILNEDFRAKPGSRGAPGREAMIEFYLATTDPEGNPTTGVTYSVNNTWFNDGGSYYNTLAWNTNRYLNIYTNSGGGALGYTPALPASGIAGSRADRVVVLWSTVGRNGAFGPPFNLGRTVTHEVGHWLGLWHTFDGGCGSATSCYSTGDLVCDTDREQTAHFGCSNSSTCGDPDPIHNYMNYTDDACMWEFTDEQVRRMRCTLQYWRPQAWTTCNAATVASRNAGLNPDVYAAALPRIGEQLTATVDLRGSGYESALVFGFSGSGQQALGSGYVALFDLASPLVLSLPAAAGPIAQFSFPVPNAMALCGLTIYTQAAELGGASGFALTNAQDLTFGR
jgi:hypothetical protein